MTDHFFFRQSDFDPASPDASDNIPDGLVKGCGHRITTAIEYFNAFGEPHGDRSTSGFYIDYGRVPHVASIEAEQDGTWPWQEIEDIGVRLDSEGNVQLVLTTGVVYVSPDTLVFWR